MQSIQKTIYLIRHGQSEGNISPVFQSFDSPLSSNGREQAVAVASRVKKIEFDIIVSSPQMRAKQTAEEISKFTGKNITYSDFFIEIKKPASIENKPHTDTIAQRVYKEWRKSLFTNGMRIEEGENYDDLIQRSSQALEYLANLKEKEIVVATHGFFLRTIIANVLFGSRITPDIYRAFIDHTEAQNTGISVLHYTQDEFEYKWRLWIYNDHAHLG